MSDTTAEQLALRLVRFLRRTNLSPRNTLPTIEELAGAGTEDDSIDAILESLDKQEGSQCAALTAFLSEARQREAEKVRNRRQLGETITDETALLLGDIPTELLTSWSLGTETQALIEDALELLADVRFLDQQEADLPGIRKLIGEKYEAAASGLRPQLDRLVGDIIPQLPDTLGTPDSPLRQALSEVVSQARERTREGLASEGRLKIDCGQIHAVWEEIESALAEADYRQRRRIFDAVLDWPDVRAVPMIKHLCESSRDRERAVIILTLRFGSSGNRDWNAWSDWLAMQARIAIDADERLRDYAGQHAAAILLIWYSGVLGGMPDTVAALQSLCSTVPEKTDFISRWEDSLSSDEWNSIDPESVQRVRDHDVGTALTRLGEASQIKPPPLPKTAATVALIEAMAEAPAEVAKPQEPRKPSFWEVHVQPMLSENWYVFAGIAMVIVGASLLAYYTWDKAWWIRYTIMPGLLGGFTWALPASARWIERKGDEFKSMAAMLSGAAIGLLPLNFMLVPLLARDANVPSKAFLALLMASVYLVVFGRGLLRWCAAVAPELRWLAGGPILLINALVILEPLNAAVFNSAGSSGALNITFGFYLGFIAVCVATVHFARNYVRSEKVDEIRIPWFFGGTLAITFLQVFAWAHGMADPRPSPSWYCVMVIMGGWLVLFVERRNIELFDHDKSYRAESFLGFALIFLGILLSATNPILRIISFLLGGGVWLYQSSTRKEAIHHWIGLTLLVLGGATIATTEGFPRQWVAIVGVVMGLGLGLTRFISRSRQREQFAEACAGMQMVVMLLSVVVAVLAQWHYHTAPLTTGIVLVLIAAHFIYSGLREDRLTWIHTAMMIMAMALPFLGFVDLEKRTWHGNTMVFGLSILSFGWLAMLAILRRPLLYSARSTVLWLYGTLAVVAMLVRVALEQGTPTDPLWYLNYMDYTGPLLMAIVLVLATFYSRSLIPALMAVFIVVILFPELKENLKNTLVDRLWGSGFGSALSSVVMVIFCFLLRQWKFLLNLTEGDRFFGKDQFPLRRTDHTLFTWPILAAACFLAIKVDTWNLWQNLSPSGVPIKTALAVCLTTLTWTLFGVYHAREKRTGMWTIAGVVVLFAGIWLLNWSQASEPQWIWTLFVIGMILQGLALIYRYGLESRFEWTAAVLTHPTNACLRVGTFAGVGLVFIGIFVTRNVNAHYWLAAFLAGQLIVQGLRRKQGFYGALLYGLGLVIAIALRHPGEGALFGRIDWSTSLNIALSFNVGALLIAAWRGGPAIVKALGLCASAVTLSIGCLLLGNIGLNEVWSMDGLWLLAIGALLLAAVINSSLPYVTVAMLLSYCGLLWPVLEPVEMTVFRMDELCMPWRLGLLSFAMVALLRLGQRILRPLLAHPALVPKLNFPSPFRDTGWIEYPAVGFALIATAIQSFDADFRNVPLQTLAPYVGALTLAMVGWFRRRGEFYCVAAALLFVGNLHIVRVFLGDPLRANGLSDLHIVCFGIGLSLGQLALVRPFVKAKNGGVRLNQSGLVMAGTILILLSANYLAHPNLAEITSWRFFFSGAMALMTGWYFRWASLSPGPGEEQYVNVTQGLYHFGVTIAIWCAGLLIPFMRDPAIALFALALPAVYFYLRAGLGLRSGLPEAVAYRNSAIVMGFLILALYTFRGAFQMLLFPGIPVDVQHYHYNAPLIVALSFLLLRLRGLGGTNWLAFYGGLALMVGSYFLITWIPELSPFTHHLAAAWTALALGHFWIAVSVARSPLRTFVQRLAQLDDPHWFTLRRSWGLLLTLAIHAAVLPALLDFDKHSLMIAPLLVGLATILLGQGAARRSATYCALAGVEVLMALHADFLIPSYLPSKQVVWVLIGLWTAGLALHQFRSKWMPIRAMASLAVGCGAVVGLHVLYHGPTSTIGWWAVAIVTLLAALNPQSGRDPKTWEEKAFAAILLLAPTWLVFFSLLEVHDSDHTNAFLLTILTIFASGAFARWFQARLHSPYRTAERTHFRLWDQTCCWMGSEGHRICYVASAVAMVAGFGLQVMHYGYAFSGFELGALLLLQAGLAFAWHDIGKRSESMIPSYLMQLSFASFFIAIRRHLMLTTGFWNYEYDVWAMLAASYCLAGLKPLFESQSRKMRMPMFSTMLLLPLVACAWVMIHNLGTDAALLVVGLYSLKFAFLGRDNRESPYNVIAIFGFVAFVLLSFWGKLEVRYVHAYVIPVGIAVLVLLQMFGRHVDAATRTRVRLLTLIAMIGSSGYYALIDERHEIVFNLILIGLSLLSMLFGSFFRIRLYLTMGMAGLLIDLASIVFKVMLNMERTSRMTTIGSLVLLIGAGLVFGAIYYKTHRKMLDERMDTLRNRLGGWE